MKWRRWFLSAKDYFSFNRAERRAVIGLSTVVILAWSTVCVWRIYHHRDISIAPFLLNNLKISYEQASVYDTSTWNHSKKWEYRKPSNHHFYTTFTQRNDRNQPEKKQIDRSKFNPNWVDSAFWVDAGLSPKQAAVLMRSKKRIGEFEFKEDLKKVVVISEAFYQEIAPWIDLPERGILALNPFIPEPVDINLADEALWSRLPGIKEKQIRAILQYRNSVGAFYSINQIQDIYGVGEYHFQNWKPYLTITAQPIKRMNVNYCGWRELADLPFFGNGLAQLIVSYRNEHGPFKSWDTWIEQGWISKSDMEWIVVYFKM